MPTINDLLEQAYGPDGGKSEGTRAFEAATSATPISLGRTEPLAQAAQSDEKGISALLDFTNPRNMPQAAGAAIQAGGTAMLGPEASVLMRLLVGAGTSMLGGAMQRGEVTPSGLMQDAALGAGSEGLVSGGGWLERQLSGKAGLQAEAAAAEAEAASNLAATRSNAELAQKAKLADVEGAAAAKATAEQTAFDTARTGAIEDQKARLADVSKAAGADALAGREAAVSDVESARAKLDDLLLRHSDRAAQLAHGDALEAEVRRVIGAPSPLENPTIESLNERAMPVRSLAERGVRGVFRGIGQKFEDLLQPYYQLPVSGDFRSIVDAERSTLEAGGQTVTPKMTKLMDEVAGLNPPTPPPPPSGLVDPRDANRPGRMTQAEIKARTMGMLGRGQPGTTVQEVDGLRRRLTGVVTGDGSSTDRLVANRMIQALDSHLEGVLPPETQAAWTQLRSDWREANNVFSPNFRSMLFKADTPERVADVLYGSAQGKNADRVLTVLGKTPPAEKPLLRSAFAEKLARGDVVKNVEGLDPRVFKAFFNGSGFENPKAWTDALRTNISEKFDMPTILSNPVTAAKFNARIQEGMNSFGARKAQAAIDAAEAHLRSVKDPGAAIADAMKGELTPPQAGDIAMRGKARPDVNQAVASARAAELTPPQAGDVATAGMERPDEARVRGGMEGMREPLLGQHFSHYIQRHMAWKVGLSMAAIGMVSHNPAALAVPLVYLGGSKAIGSALANPVIGKTWYNMLTSKNYEQAGFWLGRLAAGVLSESVREARPRDK
jgi:hypothetical protein